MHHGCKNLVEKIKLLNERLLIICCMYLSHESLRHCRILAIFYGLALIHMQLCITYHLKKPCLLLLHNLTNLGSSLYVGVSCISLQRILTHTCLHKTCLAVTCNMQTCLQTFSREIKKKPYFKSFFLIRGFL